MKSQIIKTLAGEVVAKRELEAVGERPLRPAVGIELGENGGDAKLHGVKRDLSF
jgi:hypothetical protein